KHFEKVYAFDIQALALNRTRERLSVMKADHVRLILDSHINMKCHIDEAVDVFMFNLGWLPGADKSITTQADHTVRALEVALELLALDGLIAITLYPGHHEGLKEAQAVEAFLASLDAKRYSVLRYAFLNRNCAPYNLLVHQHLND
ncbi:MAG: rRNA methyltransferase, partial [Acholeplasmatales bacterium]